MPWKVAPVRHTDEVRPIFWANRAASYLSRTSDWDEFPNGRWGDARSPAYGEITDYYLAFKRPKVMRAVVVVTETRVTQPPPSLHRWIAESCGALLKAWQTLLQSSRGTWKAP